MSNICETISQIGASRVPLWTHVIDLAQQFNNIFQHGSMYVANHFGLDLLIIIVIIVIIIIIIIGITIIAYNKQEGIV